MSFKFDLQNFAIIENNRKNKFYDNNSRIVYAYTDERDKSVSYMAWLVNNIDDIGDINSMAESTSPKKDYWNQDRVVEEMNAVFSLNSYISDIVKPKKLKKLSNEWRDKEFMDIEYFNNALSHMKLADNAVLNYAFYQLGNKNGWSSTKPAIPETPLRVNLLDFEKAIEIDGFANEASVNLDLTGIKLNPKITKLEYTFACRGYAKGILDIDYSNITKTNQFLPVGFFEEDKLKAILGEDNKIIKFSKPPKIKGRSSNGILDCATRQNTPSESEYTLDLSNWDLSEYDPSYDPQQGGGNILGGVYVRNIIFPEGHVFKITGNQFSAYLAVDSNLKRVENLAYDFSELDLSQNGLYTINQILSGADLESLDEDMKIKLIGFPETELYALYKGPDNGYDGEEYNLETMYRDIIGVPLKNIEFINKR